MNNVALNKTATSSSYVSPFAAGKAMDGTLTPLSRWLCDGVSTSTPGRLQVDLGAPYWINWWIVQHMATVGWPTSYVNAEFYLQGSMDNANWFTMDTVSDNTSSTTDRTIAPMQARYVKVSVTSGLRANKGVASIVDLQIIESDYNPYLANLTISNGTLDQAFNSKVFSYTDQVGSEVGTVTVTPTAQVSTSIIKVNNVAVTSGQASQPITLQDGNNYITVAVTNGPISQTYTIVVTKQTHSDFTYLSNLVLNGPRGTIAIAPSFDKNIFEYNANAGTAASVTNPTGGAYLVNQATATLTIQDTTLPDEQQYLLFPVSGIANGVSPDKTWQIVFNQELEPKTVDQASVFICNATTGERQQVSYELANDPTTKATTLTIKPTQPYVSGQSYILYITTGVKTVDDSVLKQGLRVPFSVK